jgi:glutathione reductase (NADPH)
MERKFDLVVIGTGSAASTAAYKCREAGWNVAVADCRPFGGTCALRGCDPKKVLVGAADLIDWVRRMESKGVHGDNACIEWTKLMRFKRTFTDPVPKQWEKGFVEAGIETFHTTARFTAPNKIQIGDDVLEARHVLIASGAKPQKLNIPGEEYLTTSEQFLDLDSLPRRIVFVGGGYISFEFTHVAARSGAKVTLLHKGEKPLEKFDPDLVEQLIQRTRALNVDVQLQTQVKAITKSGDSLVVTASTREDDLRVETDMVVHGAGRVADIEDLNLSAAGVRSGKRGVTVNEYLQSVSNSAVYAAGDSADTELPPLTPVAEYEGSIAASNLLGGNHTKIGRIAVPTIVYTVPPLATVGLSEGAARAQGLRFRVHSEKTGDWYSSRRVAEDCSGFKVLIEEGSGRVLGANVLGQAADELINLFALAIQSDMRAETLKESIFAYPTHGSDVAYML